LNKQGCILYHTPLKPSPKFPNGNKKFPNGNCPTITHFGMILARAEPDHKKALGGFDFSQRGIRPKHHPSLFHFSPARLAVTEISKEAFNDGIENLQSSI